MLRVERDEVSFETVNVGPNGNWMHQGRPFTGVAYTLGPDGTVVSEQEFRDGLRCGPAWERYRSGQMYSEASFYRDVLHGHAREWHENGQLAEEGEYEYGIPIWEKKWDGGGALVEEYTLTEADSNFTLLQSFRRIYGGASEAEPRSCP
jgi:antitoxin component YwqK of YwqJK toxin-antitoxin module